MPQNDQNAERKEESEWVEDADKGRTRDDDLQKSLRHKDPVAWVDSYTKAEPNFERTGM